MILNRQRSLRACVMLTAVATIWGVGPAAYGADASVKREGGGTKRVSWDLNLTPAALAAAQGDYQVGVKTLAECLHGVDEKTPTPLTGKWSLSDGLLKQDDRKADVAHAHSTAKSVADMNQPVPLGGNRYLISGKVTAESTATAELCPGATSHARGEAWSRVAYNVKGLPGTFAKGVSTVTDATNRNGKGTGTSGKRNGWNDPIHFGILDSNTGDTLLDETLFDLSVSADSALGDFEWGWDDTGVLLSTPRGDDGTVGGDIKIIGDTLSDLIINPIGDFTATLSNGVFVTTGAWATLPWSLTYDGGDVVSAFLPFSAFSTALSFDVAAPDGLLAADGTYDLSVNYDDSVFAEANNVPSVGPLAVGMATAALMLRRRR